jgi:ribonuclease HII
MKLVVGIDEVGRGCLAGPLLVVAARQVGKLPPGLADSKVLSRQKRASIFLLLMDACQFGEGWVRAAEIDKLGLTHATKLGVRRALQHLKVNTEEEIIIDGNINYAPKMYKNVSLIIDADALIPIVSAASVYAKVKRDNFMRQLHEQYPNYGFETHVGYGTLFHRLALQNYGAVKDLHRMSFRPLRVAS